MDTRVSPNVVGNKYDTKATNPKDAIAGKKLPLDLVPATLEAFAALGFLEGALKYGKFNWRKAGVKFSVYIGALKRHTKKLEDGEWRDAKTRVPHLASILACAGIALDAYACGKLKDDRAPAVNTSALIDSLEAAVAHLKEVFKDHNPHQFTIEDSEHGYERIEQGVLRQVPRHAKGKARARRAQRRASRSRASG
jgi:hypothetical protein